MSFDPFAGVDDSGFMTPKAYDAIVLASFGGPEGQDDVIPFLRNVTRGRGIPDERLEEVAVHYRTFGGISPINQQNRDLRAALEDELARRGIALPVLWGNRNWAPYLGEVLQEAYDGGHRQILALTTSAYSCYSSCRQYREDFGGALTELGLDTKLNIDKVRQYFDHPGFVGPFVQGVREDLDSIRAEIGERVDAADEGRIHILFCTHSIPTADAQAAGPRDESGGPAIAEGAYVAQHLANAEVIIGRLESEGIDLSQVTHSLVYQSRSGAPHVPWLEPDVNDALEELAAEGVTGVVVVPLGFVSDHMEVAWDLDTEAKDTSERLGLAFRRTPTPGTHPDFVSGLADLIEERLAEPGTDAAALASGDAMKERPAATSIGPWPDVCPANCCVKGDGSKPTVAAMDSTVGVTP